MSSIEYSDQLAVLRRRCNEVLSVYGGDEALAAALSGLQYAFKSLKFVPPLHDTLMSGTESVLAGNGDEAAYFAESMLRSLHSSGDLLAAVIVKCCHLRTDRVYVHGVPQKLDPSDPVRKKVDSLLRSPAWLYVQAFANTAKHNAFVERTSVAQGDSQMIVFKSFVRGDHRWNSRSFGRLLQYADVLLAKVDRILADLLKPLPALTPFPTFTSPTPSAAGQVTASFTPPAPSAGE